MTIGLSTVISQYATQTYSTRQQFVAATATPSNGAVVSANGIQYLRSSGATAIPDLPGWVPAGVATPEHFGAVGNGTTDDTASLQACFSAYAEISIPQKTYLVSARLTRTGSLTLHGSGKGQSILRWTQAAATRGIRVLSPTAPGNVSVEGIELQTLGVGVGTALEITLSGQIISSSVIYDLRGRVSVREVAIGGATTHNLGNGWAIGVHVTDALHVECNNVHVVGGYTALPAHGNIFTAAAFRVTNTSNATIAQFVQCAAYFATDALLCENYEGIFVTQCNFVACTRGIRTLNTVSEPQLTVAETHINAYVTCISASLQTYLQVTSCLLYGRPDMSASANFIFIVVGAAYSFIGSGTSMTLFGNPATSVGVDITGGTGHKISDVTFRGMNTAIRIGSGASGVATSSNVFVDVPTRYVDNAADSALVARSYSASASVAIGTTLTNLVSVAMGSVVAGQKFIIFASVAASKLTVAGDVSFSISKSSGDTAALKMHHNSSSSSVRIPAIPASAPFAHQWSVLCDITTSGTLTMLLSGTSSGSGATVAADGEQLQVVELT